VRLKPSAVSTMGADSVRCGIPAFSTNPSVSD